MLACSLLLLDLCYVLVATCIWKWDSLCCNCKNSQELVRSFTTGISCASSDAQLLLEHALKVCVTVLVRQNDHTEMGQLSPGGIVC